MPTEERIGDFSDRKSIQWLYGDEKIIYFAHNISLSKNSEEGETHTSPLYGESEVQLVSAPVFLSDTITRLVWVGGGHMGKSHYIRKPATPV